MADKKVLDFNTFKDGFEVLVDVGKSTPVASAVLVFPNETTVTIKGDENVVKQLIDRLDGVVIEYEDKQINKDSE